MTVEIDCPPANVLDLSVMRELDGAVAEASGNKNMKVLMITAAGGKLFSAGVDVVDHTPVKVDEKIDVCHGMVRCIRSCPVPTVAALSGAALGGCEFIMRACGCIINDSTDRNLDAYVERAKLRPLASAEISVTEVLWLFMLLGILAFGLVLMLNALAIKLSIVGILLTIIYPYF